MIKARDGALIWRRWKGKRLGLGESHKRISFSTNFSIICLRKLYSLLRYQNLIKITRLAKQVYFFFLCLHNNRLGLALKMGFDIFNTPIVLTWVGFYKNIDQIITINTRFYFKFLEIFFFLIKEIVSHPLARLNPLLTYDVHRKSHELIVDSMVNWTKTSRFTSCQTNEPTNSYPFGVISWKILVIEF